VKILSIDMPAPMAAAFRACRPHFIGIAVFSGLLNLLFLTPSIYMLQVYDRVVPTGGLVTLGFITLVVAFALGSALGAWAAWRRGGGVDRALAPALSLLGAFPYFWLAMAVTFIPFIVANGILTGLPVVLYDDRQNLGIRAGTIPIEDFLYSFAMLLLAFSMFDLFSPSAERPRSVQH
jgi:lycopene cyclase domain-containing protein